MKIVEVLTDEGHVDTILSIAEQNKVVDVWHYAAGEDGRQVVKLLVSNESTQLIIDSAQKVLSTSDISRIVVLPVEATIPRLDNKDQNGKKAKIRTSREELYQNVEQNARLDRNYIFLVILSTIVAAVGMLENNIAVVIGAMVIAPLLSPNIALALGTVLGDRILMFRAIGTLLIGIIIALATSFALSSMYSLDTFSQELLDRTKVGFSSIAMALASGAAAALSMTTGLSTVLVGVMVAVAILPPTAAVGLMLGYQEYVLAFGAFMLLAINIVCINLSADIVFLLKGINPRTTGEKKKALRNAVYYFVIWMLLLVVLVLILFRTINQSLVPAFLQ